MYEPMTAYASRATAHGAAVSAAGSGPAVAQALEEVLARATRAPRSRSRRSRRSVCASLPPSSASGAPASAGQRPAISVDEVVVRRQHRPVSRFDRRDLVEEREVGVERHLSAIEEQQVIEREEHARFAQARGDVEDVPPQRLHRAVQRLGHAVDAEVHLEVGAREAARHFLAHDEVRGVRMRGEKLEAAVDGVVIGERDEIHAARLGHCDRRPPATNSNRGS